ncbi:FliM/FliN family flagellar motor C-terminal domain-containing protein [Lacisediminimonas sp.]|uniref:FliM/FliN family flagellar motor C-terminal domain-containing protein n=1 Tax=Lacisediminimonas sp. TaxID=3060582 RepID=UPI0027227848|nr:FliM/FliN family flagellar motor C-terminal domain-containing protein [Lacisediminimonas sp.]MDO8299553.1 FliM/FliN family flagellar motor C-terminal domain-containing protein [Lacisediminimonas sp.]
MPAMIAAYTIFTGRSLAAVHARLDAALALWHAKWLPASTTPPRVHAVSNAHEAGAGAVHVSVDEIHVDCVTGSGAGAPACRLIAPLSALHCLLQMATGDAAPDAPAPQPMGAFERALVKRMLADLADSIAAAVATSAAKSPARPDVAGQLTQLARVAPAAGGRQEQHPFMATRGSGVVLVVLGIGEQRLRMLLSPALAWRLAGEHIPAPGPAQLASRRAAIGAIRIKLRVCAGDATLRLSDLMQLAPGHVLRLDLKPGQPFILEAAGKPGPAGHAWLGQLGQHKAIQLNHPSGSTT